MYENYGSIVSNRPNYSRWIKFFPFRVSPFSEGTCRATNFISIGGNSTSMSSHSNVFHYYLTKSYNSPPYSQVSLRQLFYAFLLFLNQLLRGQLYWKFSFGEVFRRFYGHKFRFKATRQRSRKTMTRRRETKFPTVNRRHTSPNENFHYDYPHSNAVRQLKNFWGTSNACFLSICFVKKSCTVCTKRQALWANEMTLSNQTSRYIRERIRITSYI